MFKSILEYTLLFSIGGLAGLIFSVVAEAIIKKKRTKMNKTELRKSISEFLKRRMKQNGTSYSEIIRETKLDSTIVINAVNYGICDLIDFIEICKVLHLDHPYIALNQIMTSVTQPAHT